MYTALVIKGEKAYVAQCIEYDVVSQGATSDEAVTNLKEAVQLYLSDDDTPSNIMRVSEASLLHFDLAHA